MSDAHPQVTALLARFVLETKIEAIPETVRLEGTRSLVNIIGCAFIGWFAAFTGPGGRAVLSGRTRAFVMVGICGGFTTFSSCSLETLNLLRDGYAGRAIANVSFSVGLCMLGVWLGSLLATAMNR